MTPLETVAGIFVYFLGCTIQGTLGFGANLLAVPTLALINPEFVPGPVLLVNPVLTALLSYRERGEVQSRTLGWLILGRIPGIALGITALSLISEERIELLFALLLLIAIGLRSSGFQLPRNFGTVTGAGLASGFMGTTVGVGGPPVAIVLSDLPGATFRATISPFFLFGTLLSLLGLSFAGKFDLHDLATGLWLLPGVFVGVIASGPLRPYLDTGRTSSAVYMFSTVAAIALLIRSLI